MFLIGDGEEAGLLGAEAFVADPALAREVEVVINVENRGTWGSSNLFETSNGNRWLIRQLARTFEHPQATSLSYEIYRLLPNDTDVTVFKRAGKAAVNFAAIRGVNWYHTPFDDLEHASMRTLQHHGENTLASVRALANTDLSARSRVDAVYFDLLQFRLVWWPEPWTLWIAIGSLVLLMVAARKKNARDLTVGVLAAFAGIALSGVVGVGAAWVARLGSESVTWSAQPLAAIVAMWLAGIGAAILGAAIGGERDRQSLLYGVAIVWHAVAIAVAITLPGAAFLFLVPAVVVTICAIGRLNDVATAAAASTAAAVLFFPIGIVLYETLGAPLMPGVAVALGVVATLFAPALSRRASIAMATIILAFVAAGTATQFRSTSLEKPATISLAYIDDATLGEARWVTDTLTPEISAAARFARAERTFAPWRRRPQWTAPAPRTIVPRVSLSGHRTSSRVSIRVRTMRAASWLTLHFHGDAPMRIVRVNGVTPPPRTRRYTEPAPGAWRTATAWAVEEMIVEIETRGKVEVVASDVSFALPRSGEQLARARDLSIAIPIQDGDMTVTRVRGSL